MKNMQIEGQPYNIFRQMKGKMKIMRNTTDPKLPKIQFSK
jgi:hypothetical protein